MSAFYTYKYFDLSLICKIEILLTVELVHKWMYIYVHSSIPVHALEMVCVIINFAAAIYFCHIDGVDLSNYPVLLNWCHSMSACSWVNYKCKNSLIGRAFGHLFLGLLMSTSLGIQMEWLPTDLNTLADDISHMKDEEGEYDYSRLILDHPCLATCCKFQPSYTLPLMILEIMLNNASPDPLILRKLEPHALGSHSSLSS